MQGVGDDAANPPEPQRSRRGGLSPYAAGAVVLALIVGAGLVFYLTNPDAEPLTPGSQTIPNSEPNPAIGAEPLTEAEAIETFRELNAQRVAMYESRDGSQVDKILAIGGPLEQVARREIRQLLRDKVLVEIMNEDREIQVVSSSSSKLIIRQRVVQRFRFTDESGNDVGISRKPQLKVIRWELRSQQGAWKFYDSKTLFTEALS